MTDLAGLPERECLAELLLRWEELYEQGQDTPAAELAKDRPDLVAELSRRIEALKAMSWVTKPANDETGGTESAAPSAAREGRLGGRYRIEALVATGGFAEVYRAFDEELQRTVAIKIPRAGRLDSHDAFLAEARRVARLKHEGIVPVYDVGVEGDTCFIVSEFLEGGSLADLLVRQPPGRDEAIRWIAEVADALEYAHLHGVVHLDIKPPNILVDHHGRAKVADFGIAQSAARSGEAGPSLGTLRYMSPEQLLGKSTDHRSDIFSLGVVLHEMLTGAVPYESLEPQTLRRDILNGSPKLSDRLEPALRDVCRRAIGRDPQARHASAAQFAAEIRRAAAPRGVARRSWLVPTVALVVLAVAGLLASRRMPQVPLPKPANTDSRVPVPSDPDPSPAAAISAAEILADATNLFFQGKPAEAEVRFTAYLELVPDDVEAITRRGLSRTRRGAFAGGVADFTRALELEPGDATLHKHRAMAHASLRQYEPAIADYKKALALEPGDRETRESFGATYSNMAAEKADAGEFATAAEIMTEAITIYPESAVFRHQRGSCLFHMGEYERALADLDEAIRREPRKPEHYENRGHCYQRLGRAEDAEREFKKAAELRNQ